MCEYLSKSSLISLSGRLSVRKIINQNRQEQYITEVVAENVTFLDYRKQDNNLNNSVIENLYENNYLDFT